MDNKAICVMYPGVNIANHLQAIAIADLGPADPREPNTEFWANKATLWRVKDGEARSRLCMNCEEYDTDEDMNGPGAKVKASDLPITPRWADIDGMPAAVCSRYLITCSAIRTCNDWEACNEL